MRIVRGLRGPFDSQASSDEHDRIRYPGLGLTLVRWRRLSAGDAVFNWIYNSTTDGDAAIDRPAWLIRHGRLETPLEGGSIRCM